jgi:hypothetical protein
MGQQLNLAMAKDKADKIRSLYPVQFTAYFTPASIWSVIGTVLSGLSLMILSKYSWGRSLLLRFPELFSFGVFSKKSPSEAHLKEGGFVSTFIGRGYKGVVPAVSDTTYIFTKYEMEMVAKVSGPESGVS